MQYSAREFSARNRALDDWIESFLEKQTHTRERTGRLGQTSRSSIQTRCFSIVAECSPLMTAKGNESDGAYITTLVFVALNLSHHLQVSYRFNSPPTYAKPASLVSRDA